MKRRDEVDSSLRDGPNGITLPTTMAWRASNTHSDDLCDHQLRSALLDRQASIQAERKLNWSSWWSSVSQLDYQRSPFFL